MRQTGGFGGVDRQGTVTGFDLATSAPTPYWAITRSDPREVSELVDQHQRQHRAVS